MTETIVHTGITELFSCCKGGKDFVSNCECCCGKMSTNLVNSDSSFYDSSDKNDKNDVNSSDNISIELTNTDKKLDCILTTISNINMTVIDLTNRVNDLEKKLIVNELTTKRNRSVPVNFDRDSQDTDIVSDSENIVKTPVKNETNVKTPKVESKMSEPVKTIKRKTPVSTPMSEMSESGSKSKKSPKPKKTVIDLDTL